ncbi:MAG: hypothetical protein IJ509_02760 [Bacilli bacterium]|nr:hypothetical protein [Bacilli bacterium]
MFIYKVQDLYVGRLGFVTKTHKETSDTYHVKEIEQFIIFKKEQLNLTDYQARDIFSNRTYYFFWGNNFIDDTIDKAVNGIAIANYLPLDQFLEIPKKYITKKELMDIHKEVNSVFTQKDISKEEKKEKNPPTEPITDAILTTILKTSDLVKTTEMDKKFKETVIKELEELGRYYVEVSIKLAQTNNPDELISLGVENEYSLRMNCMKRLVEIEEKIKNPTMAKVRSLRNQYNQFQKNLNNHE